MAEEMNTDIIDSDENPIFYEQACEMWRHNDSQYGQIFIVFIAQSIGVFLLIFAQELGQKDFSDRVYISIVLLIMNMFFFSIFIRLRSLLNSFQKRIRAFEDLHEVGKYRKFRKSLWPTSYSMIAMIFIITIVEVYVLLRKQ